MLIARSRAVKKRRKGSTFATSASSTSKDNSKTQQEWVLRGKGENFEMMNVEERGQKAKEVRLCFKCLSDAHQMRICSGSLSNVIGFGKSHHRLLHRPYKNVKEKVEEVRNFLNEKQWCPTSHSSNDREREQNVKNVRLEQIWSESVVN